jgi:hypothetical protein
MEGDLVIGDSERREEIYEMRMPQFVAHKGEFIEA